MSNPFKAFLNKENLILKQTKREGNIIYGAQSIAAQAKFVARPTDDYDIYSKHPLKSANTLNKALNRQSSGSFFVSQAIHPGTYKVIYTGRDGKKYTRDDIGVADFTNPKRNMPFVIVNGIKYVQLSETIKDKRKAMADKEYAFRKEKDKNDIYRIQQARKWGMVK